MSTNKSGELLYALQKRGYPEEFCREVTYKYMNTDFTAGRMLGYLGRSGCPAIEDLVDEMFAIISDRDRIVEKHVMENAQATLNKIYRCGLDAYADEDR